MSATLELFLKRLYAKPSHIIGQLSIEDNYFSDSLERPWPNNQNRDIVRMKYCDSFFSCFEIRGV